MRLARNDSRYHRYCHVGPDYHQSTSSPALTGAASRRLHLQTLRRRPLKASRKYCCRNSSRRLSGDHPAVAAADVVGGAAAGSSTSSFSSAYSSTSTPSRYYLNNIPLYYSPTSLHLAYLAAQIDSQSFQSLPSKIQQTYFSPEERAYIRRAYRQSLILDTADEAVYRSQKETKEPEPDFQETVDTLIPEPTNYPPPEYPQLSTLFFDSDSESDWDTESEPGDQGSLDSFDSLNSLDSESEIHGEDDNDDDMDDSLYDSFRWLDEDGDLDLTLDEYHNHVVNTVPKMPSRRKPSFRRTMSFGTGRRARRATPSVSAIPTSSQSSNVPSSLAHIAAGRNSTSRPPSSQQRQALHAPRASTSSIDPSAQYYQDPEARLKLRVYLASPQKFDEAVEFGFPSLENDDAKENNENNARPEKVAEQRPRPVSKVQKITGTFFEDEDGSVHGHRDDKPNRKSSRFSVMKGSQSPAFPAPKRQSLPVTARAGGSASSGAAAAGVGPRQLPGNREMTLKMTLTRPDLRTDSPSTSPTSAEDPLKLEELPPADYCPQIWDSDSDHQQNVMKKMWRRLRKQK